VRKLPTPIERNAEDAKLLIQVIEYYHETLLASPEALDYLKRRGIGSEEAIKTFKLGYANRTLGIGCRRRIAWRGRRCAGSCSASVSCARADTSILTARS
jgi:hypothetical protein